MSEIYEYSSILNEKWASYKKNTLGSLGAAFWGYSLDIPRPYNREDLLSIEGKPKEKSAFQMTSMRLFGKYRLLYGSGNKYKLTEQYQICRMITYN
jgi:hypothetical protein